MAESDTKPSRPDRSGLKTFVVYLSPEKARRLKIIGAETDRTMQKIGEDMVDEWLATHDTRDRVVQGFFRPGDAERAGATKVNDRTKKKTG